MKIFTKKGKNKDKIPFSSRDMSRILLLDDSYKDDQIKYYRRSTSDINDTKIKPDSYIHQDTFMTDEKFKSLWEADNKICIKNLGFSYKKHLDPIDFKTVFLDKNSELNKYEKILVRKRRKQLKKLAIKGKGSFLHVTNKENCVPSFSKKAEGLLYLFLPAEKRDFIIGDLFETYYTIILPKFGPRYARNWIWFQTIRNILPILKLRLVMIISLFKGFLGRIFDVIR